MVCMVFPCFRAVFCLLWFAGLKVSKSSVLCCVCVFAGRSYVPGTWCIGYNNLINHYSGYGYMM